MSLTEFDKVKGQYANSHHPNLIKFDIFHFTCSSQQTNNHINY